MFTPEDKKVLKVINKICLWVILASVLLILGTYLASLLWVTGLWWGMALASVSFCALIYGTILGCYFVAKRSIDP